MRETDGEPEIGPGFRHDVDPYPLRCQGDGEELSGWVEKVDDGGGVKDVVAADCDGGRRDNGLWGVVNETEFEC